MIVNKPEFPKGYTAWYAINKEGSIVAYVNPSTPKPKRSAIVKQKASHNKNILDRIKWVALKNNQTSTNENS